MDQQLQDCFDLFKAASVSQEAIAAKVGVTPQCINRIVRGKNKGASASVKTKRKIILYAEEIAKELINRKKLLAEVKKTLES